jgi:hypothetical protein
MEIDMPDDDFHALANRVSVVRTGSTVALQLFVTVGPLAQLLVEAVESGKVTSEDELMVIAAFDESETAMRFSRAVHTASIAAQLSEDAA